MDPILAGGISSMVTAIGGAFVLWFLKIRRDYRAGTREDRDSEREDQKVRYDAIIAHHDLLLKEMREELDLSKKEARAERNNHRKTQADHAKCMEKTGRLESRVDALEDMLRQHDIDFRPFTSGPGSGTHMPLSPPPDDTTSGG